MMLEIYECLLIKLILVSDKAMRYTACKIWHYDLEKLLSAWCKLTVITYKFTYCFFEKCDVICREVCCHLGMFILVGVHLTNESSTTNWKLCFKII